MAPRHSNQVACYHIDGEIAEMYPVDAQSAVARFPKEWSLKPWAERHIDAARAEAEAKLVAEGQRKFAEEAKADKEALLRGLDRKKG